MRPKCGDSPAETASSIVAGVASPPAAETRWISVRPGGNPPNRTTPSWFQVPPPAGETSPHSQSGQGLRRWRSFLGCLRNKNATKRPSADQNGAKALSDPGSGWAARESRARIQSCGMPEGPVATNASLLPSGESVRKLGLGSKDPFSGGPTEKRTGGASAVRAAEICNRSGRRRDDDGRRATAHARRSCPALASPDGCNWHRRL